MVIKVYQKYIIKEFLSILLKITFIFFALGFIMGVLEELNFFSEYKVGYYFPILLVLLNIPSLLYEIAPFIFLLSSQFLFIKLMDKEELITFKNHGLNNSKILSLLTSTSLIIGFLIVIIFYNFSAVLKFKYLDIKKNYTKDNKYLATITENGLWIKDELSEKILFINAKKFDYNNLIDVDIIQLDENFNFEKSIQSKKIDIKNNLWIIYDPIILDDKNKTESKKKLEFQTNFNSEKINNLFSNLSTLTLWNILELKKNYKTINYSTTEIDYHLQRIISYPFLITIMSLLSAILMLNIKFQSPKLFLIITAILASVCIYYINYFFGTMGKNEKLPLLVSIWIPILILTLISFFGMVRINEK
tara:strand:+ start:605 stop:1687 length:1083 start_codon:yes stop_codon:yes gene_type:complete